MPVLNAVLKDPYSKPPLNATELGMLLSSYVPFLAIPLGMAVDMGLRLCSIVKEAQLVSDRKRL